MGDSFSQSRVVLKIEAEILSHGVRHFERSLLRSHESTIPFEDIPAETTRFFYVKRLYLFISVFFGALFAVRVYKHVFYATYSTEEVVVSAAWFALAAFGTWMQSPRFIGYKGQGEGLFFFDTDGKYDPKEFLGKIQEARSAYFRAKYPQRASVPSPASSHGMGSARGSVGVQSLDDLRQAVLDLGLGSVLPKILEAARPAMLLSTNGSTVQNPSSTRMGGSPALTEGLDWPTWKGRSLSFLGQINLLELTARFSSSLLPPSGLLLFFHDPEQSTWGFDPEDRGSWRVIFQEGESNAIRAVPTDIPEYARYRSSGVEYRTRLTLPPSESAFVESLGLSESGLDRYLDLLELAMLPEDGPGPHQVLGYPDPIQGDMQLECQLVTNGLYCGDPTGYRDPRRKDLEAGAEDWQLLFQVESDERLGMMWGDVGRLYFWMHADAIRERRFEDAWMILQCT